MSKYNSARLRQAIKTKNFFWSVHTLSPFVLISIFISVFIFSLWFITEWISWKNKLPSWPNFFLKYIINFNIFLDFCDPKENYLSGDLSLIICCKIQRTILVQWINYFYSTNKLFWFNKQIIFSCESVTFIQKINFWFNEQIIVTRQVK